MFTGQCRLIGSGIVGQPAGYGLRRHLVNEQDEPKAPLARGERDQTDRVILVPGQKTKSGPSKGFAACSSCSAALNGMLEIPTATSHRPELMDRVSGGIHSAGHR